MIVLGVIGFGMNPAAALVIDGRIVAAAEEERFVRVKAAPGLFPGHAARFCLRQAGLKLGDVDRIAFAWDAGKYPYKMLASLVRQYVRYRPRAGGNGRARGADATWLKVASTLFEYTPGRLREDVRLGLRAHGLDGALPPIEFVSHHLAHASSAYFTSPFRDALVLTLDGSGEDVCTQVATGRGERLDVQHTIRLPHSLGWYYAAFTAYFGFAPYRHEGKLMALAALGEARAASNPWPERLDRILRADGDGYEVDPTYTRMGAHSYAERFTDALAEFVTGYDARLVPILPRSGDASQHLDPAYVDLAWGVQARLEQVVIGLARRAAEQHGLRNLCVAGGVGLNCKLNGALLASGAFDAVFVPPACNDAGAALGAALAVAQAGGDSVRNELSHACLGPEWSHDEVRTALAGCRLSAVECPDVAARVAEELERGRVVGWFQGRMELGARALGARSILASPLDAGIQRRLNLEVKGREPWRPFCPSVLDEKRGELLERDHPSPFMTVALKARDAVRSKAPGAVHVDGSVRPQTVARAASPLYHRMIEEFARRTGAPFVINTSLNYDGEPIVCTPQEALRCFYASGLDVLALGDFVLAKT
jgi:carbamoyltransferase